MKTKLTARFQPLRCPSLVFGALLAFSVADQLSAADPLSLQDTYIYTDYAPTSLRSQYGNSRTAGAWTLGGTYNQKLDPLSTLQVNASYQRISPGGGADGKNAWGGDVHYSYEYEKVPVGGFIGLFRNDTTTWGGGFEASLPLAMCAFVQAMKCPTLDNSVFNVQPYYARTNGMRNNRLGCRGELRSYLSDNLRLSANLGLQHVSTSYGTSSYSNNLTTLGFGGEYLVTPNVSVYAEYEHTYFSGSGFKTDEFLFGLKYCFGRVKNLRAVSGSGYANFPRLAGVSTRL